jgi:hypothetical protein
MSNNGHDVEEHISQLHQLCAFVEQLLPAAYQQPFDLVALWRLGRFGWEGALTKLR